MKGDVHEVECLRCGVYIGTYKSDAAADAAMKAHHRAVHGARGKLTIKSRPDPSFKRSGRGGSFFDMLDI